MTTDNLLLLPVDILVLIFKELENSDLRNLMITCKSLRDFIKTENRLWRPYAQKMLIFQERPDNRWFNVLTLYNRCRIAKNWEKGCFKSKVLVHHYSNYMPWLKFHKSEALLLTVGSEIVCYRSDNRGMPICHKTQWRTEMPKVLRNDVRTNDISRFVLKDNVLVCGNRDGCTAVYRIDDVLKKPKLEFYLRDCHNDGHVEVSAVEVMNRRGQLVVVSGSNDDAHLLFSTVRIGKERVHQRRTVTLPDCIGTKCLALTKMVDRLAIGLNGNSIPVLLDVVNNKYLMRAEATTNHRQAIRDIQWHDDNIIVYVTHSGFLQMIDTRCHKMIYKTRDPFQSTLYSVKTDGENAIIVGSAEYSRCVLYDMRKQAAHVQMYFTQRNTSPVYSLDFDSTKLITAVDRSVAVVNFNIEATAERRDYSRQVFN